MLLFVTAIALLFAAPGSPEDSLHTFRLDAVVVTGTRSAVAVRELPSPVQITDSAVMARMNGMSVADKLGTSAGVMLHRYGGASALHSVSVRGMGSDYSLILVDGIRFTTFQIGTVDLGIFPDQDVDRIETANGGSSALYGADAVGGVINIITRQPGEGPGFALSYTGGSYGLTGFHIQAGEKGGDASVRASVGVTRASNRFAFDQQSGGATYRMLRDGADFVSRFASVSTQRLMGATAVSTLSVRYTDSERGQPSAVTGSTQGASARIHDKDLFLRSSTVIGLGIGKELTVPLSWHNNRQDYRDPLLVLGSNGIASDYENDIMSAGPYVQLRFSEDHSATLGVEFATANITSNELIPSRRRQTSLFLSTRHRCIAGTDVIIYPSIRYDAFSDVPGDVSAKLGVNIGVFDQPLLRLRGSIGRNYRVPTFNDLYWIDGGNPTLTPEHARNADAGIIAGLRTDHLDLDADLGWYTIDATNKIVWQPGVNGRWTPRNIQSVNSHGLELSANASVEQDLLDLRFQFTTLRTTKTSSDGPNDATAGKQLPYVPKQNMSATLSSTLSGLSMAVTYRFTGFRYITTDNDPRYFLPTVETVDLNAGYRFLFFGPVIAVRVEVNNVTNVNYQMVSGYPLPLRNAAFRTEISF